ncbi:ead/Ea22-like family protein [Salmonella enterica subsp. diarizonae]|nr:ead/Ea22-like family protein [Salmonella enterica subsp. diarizonae]
MTALNKQALTTESARESGNILLIVAARMARRELFTPLHYVSGLPQKVVGMRIFREALEQCEETLQREVCKIVDGHNRMDKKLKEAEAKLEAAERRIAELSKAASVNNHWKPDVCPITGRMFFMWIEHETLGYVPTYGGPFDSYTIPTRDSSGEFSCERYDHDIGGWVDGEFIGLYLIDDDEQCRVCGLEERIAELEARVVNLPKRSVGEVMHMSGFSRDYAEGWCAGNDNAIHEIRTAGIKVKGE